MAWDIVELTVSDCDDKLLTLQLIETEDSHVDFYTILSLQERPSVLEVKLLSPLVQGARNQN